MTGLPRRERGRQTAEATARYQAERAEFCSAIKQIRSTLDFAVSSRGWCYILEERIGLLKGDFDRAQDLINVCRKDGSLPLDICAEDSRRACDNLEQLDDPDPAAQARLILEYVNAAHTLLWLACRSKIGKMPGGAEELATKGGHTIHYEIFDATPGWNFRLMTFPTEAVALPGLGGPPLKH